MTLNELNGFLELVEKRNKAEELVAELRERAYSVGSQNLTGMPHTPGVRDKVGDFAAEISDFDARISYLNSKIGKEEERINAFISTIEDDQVRLCIRLRFCRGMSWGEVATVLGHYSTEDSVKSRCYRYLRECGDVGDCDAS